MKNNLKLLRTEKHLYQKDIANLLNIAISTYSYWESGFNEPDQKSLIKLADFYNVSVDYLLGRTENKEKALNLKELNYENAIKNIGGYDLLSREKNIIPLVGQVVAGKPIESPEYIEGYVYVGYKNPDEYFALSVKGDSMTNAGITEKSILIVHKQNYAENGDIIIASVDGESTVKRYREDKGAVFLIPENPNYSPIFVPPTSSFFIFGKVVEIRTKL